MTQLLLAQTYAYLSFKTISTDLRAEAEAAIAETEKTLADSTANIQAFLHTSSNLDRIVNSLSRQP